MFLHFGMNTYLNVEWSDGTALASTYAPPADMAEKRPDGWKCKACRNEIHYTDKPNTMMDFVFGIVNTQNMILRIRLLKNKVDIVKAVSDACHKEG